MTGTENRERRRTRDKTDRDRDDREKDTKRHKVGKREGADHTARGGKAKGLLSEGFPGLEPFSNHVCCPVLPWGINPRKGGGQQ